MNTIPNIDGKEKEIARLQAEVRYLRRVTGLDQSFYAHILELTNQWSLISFWNPFFRKRYALQVAIRERKTYKAHLIEAYKEELDEIEGIIRDIHTHNENH